MSVEFDRWVVVVSLVAGLWLGRPGCWAGMVMVGLLACGKVVCDASCVGVRGNRGGVG